ncbi:2-dehydro-3-deoxyglucarate aldolase/4-hydroxy-2-oxoheptanedioate aldolase [Rhodoligotrophos appendicifer]|uniref:HpcH/HpaI aldolase family protein n=1 Tax=Rhodoligotrophos appendicifer TaxID=987056 RepID=UPI0011859715|nr:aldolase/citrate lyase family protein [Rhodoligotrophos appendicifer]
MSGATIRELLETKDLKIGTFLVEFSTPGIGQILAATGCQFAFVDLEHSGFSFETLKSMLRYLQAGNVPSIVRIPSKRYDHVARACDMGAEGIMVPMVETVEEAKSIIDSMKYVPTGKRGVALRIAHDRYSGGPVLEKLDKANRKTAFFPQIETALGVENADALAALEGVDCLWIGHFDLTCSMGIPGQFDHPTFIAAEKRVADACKKHGKSFGYLVQDVAAGVRLRQAGVDFLCYSGDVWLLQSALTDAIQQVREKTGI